MSANGVPSTCDLRTNTAVGAPASHHNVGYGNNHHNNHYHHLPGRYYATERRRRQGYPSFSIMKWFRRSKHCDDDADSTWFRDDLMRIRQAYVEQDPDYAAVTPIAGRHRRPTAAATWSRWSGSTTTVHSFAYVDGEQADVKEQDAGGYNSDDDDDDEDTVEYIDAATLPVARLRAGQRPLSSPSIAFEKSPMTTSSRATPSAAGTMTATYRRRYKKAAPPPPPPLAAVSAADATVQQQRAPSSSAQQKTSTVQRRTATISRKKYRAPQPPTVQASESQPKTDHRRPALHRRKKGPAPKPPVLQQLQPQQLLLQRTKPEVAAQSNKTDSDIDGGGRSQGSNVRRKISQYERDRLMQRVDKIEKHFLQKNAAAAVAATTDNTHQLPWTVDRGGVRGRHHGFASPAALYTAMAATNLTELDKRAAEICRLRNRLVEAQRPAAITDDHKNAIVAAVMRKSHPTTTTAASDEKRPKETNLPDGNDGGPSTTRRDPVPDAADDLQTVRRKRLAFFQQRAAVFQKPTMAVGDGASSARAVVTVAATVPVAATVTATMTSGRAAAKSTSGTQTVGAVVVAKTLSRTAAAVDGGCRRGQRSSSDSIKLPSEDNNCYQQLMAMEMQSDLVFHIGPFECAVCLCTYDNNGVVLRDCLHVFCRPCLQMTIGHSKAEKVECPYIDEHYSCTGVLQHREIKKILDSDEEYEKFLQRSVERARQLLAKERNGASFQCRRPDCTGWCMIYDKHQVLEFKCPVCGTVTCVQCGSIHTQKEGCKKNNDFNNSEDSSQDTLENLIDRGDAMLCPGCNTVLSKQQGCDWIKCAVCFLEICWATKGPRWGPQGKGDITGGCKCGIPPGRKCHSECKYCH